MKHRPMHTHGQPGARQPGPRERGPREPGPRPTLAALAALLLAAACLFVPLRPALASVSLVDFTATAQGDGTIRLAWQTATEQDTIGFRIYRSDSAAPADWGQPLTAQAAQGNAQQGATYEYVDTSITPGVRYYYLLEDLTASNTTNRWTSKIASAGVNLPAETATPTRTATTQVSGGATTQPPAAGGATITPTPPPTATRQFTNTPIVSPLQPPVVVQPTQPAAAQPTPLPAANVTAPTSAPAPATAVPPAAPPATAAALPATEPPPPTTAAVAAVALSPAATATPIPAKDATPAVFAAESKEPAPTDAQAPEPGGRNTGLFLALGGTAIGLGGLIAAVVLFMRSRRS